MLAVLANPSVKNASNTVTTNPVIGVKSVTATAAAIFAGASVLANRKKMVLRNEDPAIRCRVGPSTVSQQSGFPIEPGGVLEITFDPVTAISIFAISEGASIQMAVMEL